MRGHWLVGLLAFCLMGCGGEMAADPPTWPAFTGSWGPHETYLFAAPTDNPLWVDVYYPIPAESANGGIVVTIHGGGWATGSRTNVSGWEEPVRRAGYTVISFDYRLTPGVNFIGQVADCRVGLQWVARYARQRGLDPERIAVMGVSAGAHLASLVSNAPSKPGDPWTANEPLIRPRAMIGISGAYDFRGPFAAGNRTVLDMLGDLSLAEAASPLTWLDPSDPPELLLHGDSEREPITPLVQAQTMHAAALAAGVRSELVVVRQGDHGLFPNPEFSDTYPSQAEIGPIIVAFLQSTM